MKMFSVVLKVNLVSLAREDDMGTRLAKKWPNSQKKREMKSPPPSFQVSNAVLIVINN